MFWIDRKTEHHNSLVNTLTFTKEEQEKKFVDIFQRVSEWEKKK